MFAKQRLFFYEAVDKNGVKVKGSYLGTVEDLVKYLRRKNLILIKLKEKQKGKLKVRYSLEQFLIDLQNLVFLLNAGITLDESLVVLISSSDSVEKTNFWENVLKRLKEGVLFSVALKDSVQERFGERVANNISLIKTSESVGELAKGIENFLELTKLILSTKKKIRDSLAYPVFLLVVAYFILGLIFIVVIPKFSSLFSYNDLEKLSLLPKSILLLGKFVQSYERLIGIIFLITPILFVTLFSFSKEKILSVFPKIPFVRKVYLLKEFSSLFSSMSASLKGGLDLAQALSLSILLVQDENLKKELNGFLNKIKEGTSLSSLFSFSSIFPSEVSVVLASAEKSASLPQAFDLLAKKYEIQFNNELEKFIKFLEPVIIVLLGLVLSFIIISIMMAVLSINNII